MVTIQIQIQMVTIQKVSAKIVCLWRGNCLCIHQICRVRERSQQKTWLLLMIQIHQVNRHQAIKFLLVLNVNQQVYLVIDMLRAHNEGHLLRQSSIKWLFFGIADIQCIYPVILCTSIPSPQSNVVSLTLKSSFNYKKH